VNTGIALFNSQMQSADFFDAANYPVITFKSRKMTFNSDDPVSLSGCRKVVNSAQAVGFPSVCACR